MSRSQTASDTHALNKARQFWVVLIQPPRDVVATEKNREANLCRGCRIRRQTDTDTTGGGGNHQVANKYFLRPFGCGFNHRRRRDDRGLRGRGRRRHRGRGSHGGGLQTFANLVRGFVRPDYRRNSSEKDQGQKSHSLHIFSSIYVRSMKAHSGVYKRP